MYYSAWREIDIHIPECYDEDCLEDCERNGFYLATGDAADSSHYSKTFFTMFGKPKRLKSEDPTLHRHLHHALLLNHNPYARVWLDFLRSFEPANTLTDLVISGSSNHRLTKEKKTTFKTVFERLRSGWQPTIKEFDEIDWSVLGFYPLHESFAVGSWHDQAYTTQHGGEKRSLIDVSSGQFFQKCVVETYYGFQRGHLVFRTSEADDQLTTQASWLLVKRKGCKGLQDYANFDVGRLLKVVRIQSPQDSLGARIPDGAIDLVVVECEWYKAQPMITERQGSKHSVGLVILTRNMTYTDIDRYESARSVEPIRVLVGPNKVNNNGKLNAVLLAD